MKKVLLYTLAVIFILGLIGACFGESETETTSNGTSDSAVATIEEEKKDEPKSKWEYSESVDEMTDKKSYLAYIVSENEVDFEFPYNGGSNLLLYLRNDPQYGQNIYIKITKGQFNMDLIDGQTIKVRFDEDQAFNVKCNGPSDHSMDVLFLNGYKKVVDRLKTAKTMKVSVEFFNEGTRTFTFDVANLNWEH